MAVERVAPRASGRGRSVLLTADTVGGVWTYALELARGLSAHGWHVHLATMGAPVAAHQRAQLAGIQRLTLHEGGHQLEWMPCPWADVDRAGAWLLALEQQLAPDIVHLNQFSFGALPFAAPVLLVAHSCVLSWWQAVHGEPAPASWDIYRVRVAQGLRGADLVAAPTRAMLRALATHHDLHSPALVLPNGRDASGFAPVTKQPIVLSAGRLWDEAKNLAALDAAAAGLPWPVRMAGACTGPDGAVRQLAAAQPLGVLEPAALARWMAQAAIYALPARYEPFGLSVLEAALSGCALVLGDIPSLREVWADAAVYVPPDEPQALREALARLIAAPTDCQRLGAAALARARRYTPAAMTQATLGAYAALLGLAALPADAKELLCA